MIKIIKYSGQSAEELFGKRDEITYSVEEKVKAIISEVRSDGDAALKKFAAAFDGYTGDSLEVSRGEIEEAFATIDEKFVQTLNNSIKNIENFHRKQKREGFEIDEGDRIIGQKVTPVGKAGIYVPGGTAAYPSTVLMNAIPAKIAGVDKVYMATPVKADGKVKAEVLVAAELCGVDKIYKMGGAQAIAAFAYGTETVPKVDKITGPGRDFVATAKKLVAGITCGIDMVAGPSEILVLADGGARADCVAADLLSQAEHDKIASAVLITDSQELAKQVVLQLNMQIERLERSEIARASLENNGKIIVTDDLASAVELCNEYAPEHLELAVKEPFELLKKVKNAGSVFLGYNTPEAVGDYYAGPNHTLPTSGTARFSSPLGVDDFVKTTQYVYYTDGALRKSAADIISFANSEGLGAHAESVAVRAKNE
ncbi:MAG: histidinol dehydrogenase [Clostridiales bacterium]|nr:histidinol dehydrogenase [Clostridiales bacterium]